MSEKFTLNSHVKTLCIVLLLKIKLSMYLCEAMWLFTYCKVDSTTLLRGIVFLDTVNYCTFTEVKICVVH